jgi:hypothetical protein
MDVLPRPQNRSPQLYTHGKAGLVVVAALLCSVNLAGQTAAPELRQILERLEVVERSNRELTEEVLALRGQLAATSPRPTGEGPELDEKVAVQGTRIEEQAQTKVEAGQRFPIKIKGMLLFNTYLNSKQDGTDQYPTVAAPRGEYSYGGATLRQSVLGFEYRGPEVLGGGKLHASLLMDFFGGTGQALDESLRLRTATVQIDWKSRSVMMGVDKPIFAPREPSSLAQVGVSPLTGAGNLWMWVPQVRLEQSFHWSDTTVIRAQMGVIQTRELPYPVVTNLDEVELARPGLEGRLELAHDFGSGRRVELAPGFHLSTSHVEHVSVPSRLFSMDWLVIPWRKLEFTGALFTGENVTHLGTGGVGQGFAVLGERQVKPLPSQGGWAQFTVPVTDRLSFHFFTGGQNERSALLPQGTIERNLAYGANFFYRLAPNVIVSVETSQIRTSYIQMGHRLNNHYDLAFAYLF